MYVRENDSSSSSSSFEEFYNLSWRLYSAFHMRRPQSEADAAVEMWEIRSQMRIAAREERFVAARTIKHGSPAKFGSIQMLLTEPLQTKKRLTNNTEVVSTSKFLSGRPQLRIKCISPPPRKSSHSRRMEIKTGAACEPSELRLQNEMGTCLGGAISDLIRQKPTE